MIYSEGGFWMYTFVNFDVYNCNLVKYRRLLVLLFLLDLLILFLLKNDNWFLHYGVDVDIFFDHFFCLVGIVNGEGNGVTTV